MRTHYRRLSHPLSQHQALQAHPPDQPIVPHKVVVAKRLAQCMNPSLPAGVHQKALEVYTYIFGLIKVRMTVAIEHKKPD